VAVGETYQQAVQRSGNRPPFYVTHITGWFDKYAAEYVKREHIDISPEVLVQAGWAVAHEQYRVYKEYGYEGIMLGGGALDTLHFTEMVGGDAHVTLNWNISEKLIATDPPVVSRLRVPASKEVVEELCQKLPVFRQALTVDGVFIEEFKNFGPLVLFRNMFLQGYGRLVQEIGARRVASGIAI
jgi:transaldolase